MGEMRKIKKRKPSSVYSQWNQILGDRKKLEGKGLSKERDQNQKGSWGGRRSNEAAILISIKGNRCKDRNVSSLSTRGKIDI